MKRPAVPDDETSRLAVLAALNILDTPSEEEFDAITRLAADICGVPIALVTLVDESRQWFKARVGLDVPETPREVSYCGHAILEDGPFIVPDASRDERFSDNPLRTGAPNVEFYAGIPLRVSSGHAVGTLCVIDHRPRTLTEGQLSALEALAAQVVRLLELRRMATLQAKALSARLAHDESLLYDARVPRGASRLGLALSCLVIVSTVFASLWTRGRIVEAETHRLTHAAERAAAFVTFRAQGYGEVLRGTAALFRATGGVSHAEFLSYVAGLSLGSEYHAVRAIGYVERVDRADLTRWLAEVRAEQPSFTLSGVDTTSAQLAINKFVVMRQGAQGMTGFNALSERTRNAALDAAARTDQPVMTPPLTLRLTPPEPGFILYAPVRSTEGRALGWTVAGIAASEFVQSVRKVAGESIEVTLEDAATGAPLLAGAPPSFALTGRATAHAAGRHVVVTTWPRPEFHALLDRLLPWVIFVLGLGGAALTFALTAAVRRTEEHSHALARRMTSALSQSEAELRSVVEGTSDLVVSFTDDGHFTRTNEAFRRRLDLAEEDIARTTLFDFVHPEARPKLRDALTRAAHDATPYIETAFHSRTGARIDVEGSLATSGPAEARITRAIFRDVTNRLAAERALRSANDALEKLAMADGLTGLANRRAFDQHLRDEVARARRHGGKLALALVDVDHFKLYNDRYGHPQGDACLRTVAEVLQSHVRRAGEVTARYGGEEFALLLPGSDESDALQLADALRAGLSARNLAHAQSPLGRVTISIGVAELGERETAEELLEAADRALYAAKALGRDRAARAD